jgi:hypothetical protein
MMCEKGTDVMRDTVVNWKKWVAKVEGHHLENLNATTYC